MRIDHVRSRLARHRAERVSLPGSARAAVAVVLRDRPASAEVLLIERAHRRGDPWSGHMAFPGGRLELADRSTLGAACRETREEVGLDLADAEVLGRLDDLVGNPRIKPRLVIAAHAFHVGEAMPLALDEREVQDAFWFPLADLLDESRHVDHVIPELPDIRFPGLLVGEAGRHVVWGLTYRFLDRMLHVLGDPLPDRWGDLAKQLEREEEHGDGRR